MVPDHQITVLSAQDAPVEDGLPVVPEQDLLKAQIEIGSLPPGQYRIEVALDLPGTRGQQPATVRGQTHPFDVRRSDETPELRRQYLFQVLSQPPKQPRSFPESQKLLLELGALDPDNSWVWEKLGDLSLGNAPLEETLGYYDRAVEIATRYLAQVEAAGKAKEVQKTKNYIKNVSVFRRVYPYYVLNVNDVDFMPFNFGFERRYVWIRRSDNSIIGLIDPDDVTNVVPLPNPKEALTKPGTQ